MLAFELYAFCLSWELKVSVFYHVPLQLQNDIMLNAEQILHYLSAVAFIVYVVSDIARVLDAHCLMHSPCYNLSKLGNLLICTSIYVVLYTVNDIVICIASGPCN